VSIPPTPAPTPSPAAPDYPGLLRQDGAVHIVFGAGQGIGRQAAHALSQAGSHVVCVDNDPQRAGAVATEVGGTAVTADVRDEEQIVTALDRAHSMRGRLDGIVDIVGMARFVELTAATEQDWAFHFAIVFDHARWLVRHGAALLSQTHGTLTFVSSVAALTGAQRNGPYAAAKAALVSLVQTAAVELAPHGIRVNSIAPGVIATPRMTEQLDPSRRRLFEAAIPLARLGESEEVAAALLFLASRLSTYITGQTIVLDGGVQARFPYSDFT